MSKNLWTCLCTGLALACSEPSSTVTPAPVIESPTQTRTPTSAGIQGGNEQSTIVAAALPNVLAVWVVDAAGKGVPGVPVAFAVTSGGGSILGAATVTDAGGVASSGKWTVGAQAGPNTTAATVVGITMPVTFTATAIAAPPVLPPPATVQTPVSIVVASGDDQTAPAARGIRNEITLRVNDPSGNPVPNATVTFNAGYGGVVTPSTATTNAAGIATLRGWTLGKSKGPQTLFARVSTGTYNPTVLVHATATTLRIVTFGDSNTDHGYVGTGTTIAGVSYVSTHYFRLPPGAGNMPAQLAYKIEKLWESRFSIEVLAINHGIIGSTTAGRSYWGAPGALTVVNGVSRFDAEVLGLGAPWNGGEPVNAEYSGPIVRTLAFMPTANDFVYVSIGSNDENTGISGAQTVDNLSTLIDHWTSRGLAADHFILTTLGPSPGPGAGKMPALNAGIRDLAARKGVHLVDISSFISSDDGLTWKSPALVIPDGLGVHYAEGVRDWIADQVATYVAVKTAAR